MDNKVMVVFSEKSNITDSILYLMEKEKIDYILSDNLDDIDKCTSTIIYIDNKNSDLYSKLAYIDIPILIISDERNVIKNTSSTINYILTNLLSDKEPYTEVQKEFLFKKGIYSILNNKIISFINSDDNINGLIIDIKECSLAPSDWIFKFDSIAETYSWLSKKNRLGNNNFIKKEINFYNNSKVYNDSSKEINYLVDKIMVIKSGVSLIDIFICTKEELEKLKNNYFFKSLLNNLSSTYSMYFVDKDKLIMDDEKLLEELTDGIIIYDDCVYRDTYYDEYSLGFVDCNEETHKKYNKYFDYVLEKYGLKLNSDGDINGI